MAAAKLPAADASFANNSPVSQTVLAFAFLGFLIGRCRMSGRIDVSPFKGFRAGRQGRVLVIIFNHDPLAFDPHNDPMLGPSACE